MKLGKSDKEMLLDLGYDEADIKQISSVVSKTVYTYYSSSTSNSGLVRTQKISSEKAKSLLGDRDFLTGLARSAFHFTASRTVGDKKGAEYILFDSSGLF